MTKKSTFLIFAILFLTVSVSLSSVSADDEMPPVLSVTTLAEPIAQNVIDGTWGFVFASALLENNSSEDIRVSAIKTRDEVANGGVFDDINNIGIWADLNDSNSDRGHKYETQISDIHQSASTNGVETFALGLPSGDPFIIVSPAMPIEIAFVADVDPHDGQRPSGRTHTVKFDDSFQSVVAAGVTTGLLADVSVSGSGQTMTVVNSGTFTAELSNLSPALTEVAPNDTDVVFGVFDFRASPEENVYLEKITINISDTAGVTDHPEHVFYNTMGIYNGTIKIGDGIFVSAENPTITTLYLAQPITIQKGSHVSLTFKADISDEILLEGLEGAHVQLGASAKGRGASSGNTLEAVAQEMSAGVIVKSVAEDNTEPVVLYEQTDKSVQIQDTRHNWWVQTLGSGLSGAVNSVVVSMSISPNPNSEYPINHLEMNICEVDPNNDLRVYDENDYGYIFGEGCTASSHISLNDSDKNVQKDFEFVLGTPKQLDPNRHYMLSVFADYDGMIGSDEDVAHIYGGPDSAYSSGTTYVCEENNQGCGLFFGLTGQHAKPGADKDMYFKLLSEQVSENQPPGKVVTFPDPSLEAVIREAIWKSTGDIYQSDLETLTALHARDKGISDLTGLEYAVNVDALELNFNQITDLSPLSNLTNLTALSLSHNQITDLSQLSSLTNLTALSLSHNQITDLSPLSSLTNLTWLSLGDKQITDLSPLSSLTNLTWLELSDNQITDISPLSNLTNLTGLSLFDNQITNISPLSNLTNLTRLSLYGNQITDLSPLSNLTNLTWLELGMNQITDISPLVANTGLSDGDYVYLRQNPLSEQSINTYIPQLEARGVQVSYEEETTEQNDTTPPVITLIGSNPAHVEVGGEYSDLGATATDDVDGDVSSSIVVIPQFIDTGVAGTFIVTYNVSDAAGNAAQEVTRDVVVSAEEQPPPDVISRDYSFAHITDVHVGANYTKILDFWGEEWFEEWSYSRFTDTLYGIEHSPSEPEFILISGDNVEDAGGVNGLRWLADFKSITEGFEKRTGIKIYSVPGNHDRYERPAGSPIAEDGPIGGDDKLKNYHKVMGDPSKKDPKTNFLFDGVSNLAESGEYGYNKYNYYFNYGTGNNEYQFIGLDSGADYFVKDILKCYRERGVFLNNLCTKKDEFLAFLFPEGTGLSNEHIKELEALDSNRKKVVFMHHPIFTGVQDGGYEDGSILNYRDEFIKFTKNNNVQLVLTGHAHKSYVVGVGGNEYDESASDRPLFIQTQSATKGNDYGYRIIDIKDGNANPRTSSQTLAATKHYDKSIIHLDNLDNLGVKMKVCNPQDATECVSSNGQSNFSKSKPYFVATSSSRIILYKIIGEELTDKFNVKIENPKNAANTAGGYNLRLQYREREPIRDEYSLKRHNSMDSGLKGSGYKIINPGNTDKKPFIATYLSRDKELSIIDLRDFEVDSGNDHEVQIDWRNFKPTELEEDGNGFEMRINGAYNVVLDKKFWNSYTIDLNSPAELQVTNSEGQVSGLVDGVIKEEIPYSMYLPEDEKVIVFSDNDNEQFDYKLVGTVDDVTYDLTITKSDDEKDVVFEAKEIPTNSESVHTLSVDWQQLEQTQGEEGVEMEVDEDGDGDFERTIETGEELDGSELEEDKMSIAPVLTFGGGGGGGSISGLIRSPNIRLIKADFTGDRRIDIFDFNFLMAHFGERRGSQADINNDGFVDVLDFNLLMVNWK